MGWLGGWQYRKSHVINSASGAGTNYQVRIVAHYGSGTDSGADVYLNSHCRTDFGDVRFTDYDGETLLDYWMEMKVDGDYAVFWVEVADDLSSSNATIYIYYGKSDATTTSNGANTFLFFDEFDGTDIDFNKWTLVGDSQIAYSVSDSLVRFWQTTTNDYERNPSHILTEISDNYMFEARCRTESDGSTLKYKVGVLISNENAKTASASNLVYMAINRWLSSENWNWRCEKKVNGVWSSVANSGSETITTNWRVFGIARTGTTFYVFKDYEQKASTTITTISNNYIMLFDRLACANKYNTFDWARVRKYVSPEPSHGAWGSEETPSGGQLYEVFVNAASGVFAVPVREVAFNVSRDAGITVSGLKVHETAFNVFRSAFMDAYAGALVEVLAGVIEILKDAVAAAHALCKAEAAFNVSPSASAQALAQTLFGLGFVKGASVEASATNAFKVVFSLPLSAVVGVDALSFLESVFNVSPDAAVRVQAEAAVLKPTEVKVTRLFLVVGDLAIQIQGG